MLAILSLVVALTALAYATYRNESSERNRNLRTASFEILKELGSLQTLVHYAHYEKDQGMGNPITGWGKVLFIKDLAMVLPSPLPAKTEELFQAWEKNFSSIVESKESADAIVAAINQTRMAVLDLLKRLN